MEPFSNKKNLNPKLVSHMLSTQEYVLLEQLMEIFTHGTKIVRPTLPLKLIKEKLDNY
jgi:hypothetical protein